MFGKKKKQNPTIDITQKTVKTWWGGTKCVPIPKREQRVLKERLQKERPDLLIIDWKEKERLRREAELDWIDGVEAFDAIWND